MEIFTIVIIGLVVSFIESLGKKKEEQTENQDTTPSPFDKEYKMENHEEKPLTVDEIFRELRKNKEQNRERKVVITSNRDDDYIPRAPKPQPKVQPVIPSQPIQPKPQIAYQPVAPLLSPDNEGISAKKQSAAPITDDEIGDWEDESVFDIEEIDWRQTVVATEILNRKYI